MEKLIIKASIISLFKSAVNIIIDESTKTVRFDCNEWDYTEVSKDIIEDQSNRIHYELIAFNTSENYNLTYQYIIVNQ